MLKKLLRRWLAKESAPTAVQMKGNVTLSAVVTRADGTVEDLGVIARSEE